MDYDDFEKKVKKLRQRTDASHKRIDKLMDELNKEDLTPAEEMLRHQYSMTREFFGEPEGEE